jgi:hypothetical protein
MNAFDGQYRVTNKDWQQSLPDYYPTFVLALAAQQEWDTKAIIEQFDGDTVNVVWLPEYEDVVCDNIFLLNRNTL